tara:strand:- start:4271 stop:4420 length:150 start_codon:yes stop_codon:yes gene_type:complete
MKVYDCDNEEQFKAIEILSIEQDLLKNNKLQAFSPDSLEEARNRGFKSL